ncbi:C-type lectin domain family 6 member A-like isoform X10 [Girardinichthys multiradiatus]|uniref:C-type lectin domain family 6 member A-like isoform X10 n=1 Tax=Girardinichthys multiradiatus TaxID=208333 RepID=UPI001FAD3E7C|nr:C-type lectin domain family 6 member A-like isoform X10 [Girardinichthys multiradiatus]
MSLDIYSKVDSTQKVRYAKKEQVDRTEWEEREVNIYESAENVVDSYKGSQLQEQGFCAIDPIVTLEIQKVNNSYDHQHQKLSANNNQLQDSYNILSKNHSQLTEEVNRLKEKFEGKWCPDEWMRFGSSCYFKYNETKSWSESRKHCQKQGADLVIINSQAEQDFVKKLNGNGDSWIGLKGKWIEETRTYDWGWVDGSPLTQAFWGTGWPKSDIYWPYATYCDGEGKWKNTYYYDYNYKTYDYKNWICEK